MVDDFSERFKNATANDLVLAFNREVGNPGWVTARGFYLKALREALLATGLDCSAIMAGSGLRIDRRITVKNNAFVPIDSGATFRNTPHSAEGTTSGGDSSVELATSYFRHIAPETWFIIGSGAAFGDGIPLNRKVERLLNALKAAGVTVRKDSQGSPGNCDSFTFAADFEGGHLEIRTGNYFYGRGGAVNGRQALRYLVALLGLRLSRRTARAWGLYE